MREPSRTLLVEMLLNHGARRAAADQSADRSAHSKDYAVSSEILRSFGISKVKR